VTAVGSQKRGRWLREVWESSIGKKVIVAITGAILALYVLLHALGNLKALQGPGDGEPAVDHYAEWLRDVGTPLLPHNGFLWIVRATILLALILHVTAIYQLWRRNRAARPVGHRDVPVLHRSLSSRTMMFTGLVVLAFIVFHILQFTTRTIQVTPVHEGTVYVNMYEAFQKWYFVLFYVAVMVLLLLHLRHAIWSVTQTAGWDKPNRNTTFRRFATGFAVIVGVGFMIVPLAIWTDVVPEPKSEPVATATRAGP
jgi:succinate dehydrogenase / fumarate reductase, cytochrome b subunit